MYMFWRSSSRAAALLLLPLLLTACARFLSSPPYEYSVGYANDVFESGFEFINHRYVERPDMRGFALAGLDGLREIDPAIEARPNGLDIDVLVGGRTVATLTTPQDGDPSEWARLVTDVVEAARSASPSLNQAEAEEIFEVVYDHALRKLDEFSRYAGLDDAIDARAMREGFGGIGVTIRMEKDFATIISVVPGGPADEAGIMADDRLTVVNSSRIAGWSQRDLVRQLRGQLNTRVRLTLDRAAGGPPYSVILQRKRIVPPTVEARVEGRAAIIRVSSFNQSTAAKVRGEVTRIQAEHGSTIDGFVLDLRGNPGGLLDQAVEVADVFLRDGDIVKTRGRHPHSRQEYGASGLDYAYGRPMIVLINGDSASASEVVAAALQDLGRAVVIGSNSYGKGTVQTVYRLPNNGELTLTWSRLHAPTGYRLHDLGVLPNVCTRDGEATAAANRVVNELRDGSTETQEVLTDWREAEAAGEEDLAILRGACPSAAGNPETDLEVAQAILADLSLYRQSLEPLAPSVARR